MITYEVNDHVLEVEQLPVDMLIHIPIYDKNNRMLGRAILTRNVETGRNNGKMNLLETTILLDIVVYEPEDRRKGIADELMGYITSCGEFKSILTGISTEPGRALCLKWGFKQATIKGENFLIWRKEKNGN